MDMQNAACSMSMISQIDASWKFSIDSQIVLTSCTKAKWCKWWKLGSPARQQTAQQWVRAKLANSNAVCIMSTHFWHQTSCACVNVSVDCVSELP